MKELINQIRNVPDRYGCHSWKHHISGNVTEFIVEPPHHLDRTSYRKAVINIGMAVRSLSKKLEKSGESYLIQSFPTLDDLRTVAILRTQQEPADTPFTVLKNLEIKSPLEQVQALAQKFQFSLTRISHSDLPSELKKDYNENAELYVLLSSQDHPFIWINIGFLLEVINSYSELFSSVDLIEKSIQAPSDRFNTSTERSYIQSILQV